MRERYLEAFDAIRIDCLNGDKYKTGKVAPDGAPDPSIFSTEGDPVGIQVGTAIATLVRKADHSPTEKIGFRHLWGLTKRQQLEKTADAAASASYQCLEPIQRLGLPFMPTPVGTEWFNWPALPDLMPVSFQGAETGRDVFLIDTDLDRLHTRLADYFNVDLEHHEIERLYPRVMQDTRRFDARAVRETLLRRGGPNEHSFVRHAYRPFDNRWLYWESETKLLREKSPRYPTHVFDRNLWFSAAQHLRKGSDEPQACFTRHVASRHLIERGANMFPAWLEIRAGTETNAVELQPNLSSEARCYLDHLGANVEDLFHHILFVHHDPAYREANAGALRMEWPRISLPGWPDGNTEGAAEALARSAARGREIASLLDPDQPVPGVTLYAPRPEIAALAVPATTTGRNMAGETSR